MPATILYGSRETAVSDAVIDGDHLWLPLDELERATGWDLKPAGLCFAETCVPIPAERKGAWLDTSRRRFDFAAFARHLGQAIVRDDDANVWSFGDAARAQSPADPMAAPDFRLPDLDGALHSLSDYRGKKVFLFAWASW